MTSMATPWTVKDWLSDGQEIALVDVRETGHYGDGHPFFAVSMPFRVFEKHLVERAPNPAVRLVLYDNADGIADLAAARAAEIGYTNITVMEGGAPAWKAAGYTLYEGTNVPSKTFGELLELKHHTPNLTAEQVADLNKTTPNHIIVDSRPYDEFSRFNIPGGICCHNGEVALRIGELVPDPETTIVVNCAGRTRSILGAETLRAFGVPNPVFALENGTQGWLLAGLQREEGATRSYPDAPTSPDALSAIQTKALACAERTGINTITAAEAKNWLADTSRTTFLFDVRTEEEYQANGVPGSRHALGGQLVQATDEYIGVRGCRVILVDDEMVRAPMMANWLFQLGYEVSILEGGVSALQGVELPAVPSFDPKAVDAISPAAAVALTDAVILDLRHVKAYRAGHIDGAAWAIRPLLGGLKLPEGQTVILIAKDDVTAALAAQRLGELGVRSVRRLPGTEADWRAAGFDIVATPDDPPAAEVDEMLFYVHQRNVPNNSEAGARAYLEWEIGLVDQLDDQEKASYRLSDQHLP